MSEDDGIVQIDFRADASLEIINGGRRCRHWRVVLDGKLRVVECHECGSMLDPFNILMGYAERERNIGWSEKARTKLYREIEELKKEEKRVKQRISRAKKKLK